LTNGWDCARHAAAATDGDAVSWLISPQFDLPGAGAEAGLLFWRHRTPSAPKAYQYTGVWASTGSWDPVSGDFTEYEETGPGEEAFWQGEEWEVTPYAGQSGFFAFRYEGNDADAWSIDECALHVMQYRLHHAPVTPLDFVEVALGQHATQPYQVTVVNYGPLPVDITDIAPSGDFFIESEDCPLDALDPGESCKIYVSFAPTAVGLREGMLTITSNAENSPNVLLLRGEGILGSAPHKADQDGNLEIDLSELLRVIQFYNSDGYHCDAAGEDGYSPGPGDRASCTYHDSDYNPPDWDINLSELLRVIQFFNSGGYYPCPDEGTEDGFCVGSV